MITRVYKANQFVKKELLNRKEDGIFNTGLRLNEFIENKKFLKLSSIIDQK